MLDFGHLPGQDERTRLFVGHGNYNQGRNDEPAYYQWQKPRGVSMIFMLAVGSGSNGQTGSAGAPDASSWGGQGGGGGSMSTLLIPAAGLPDTLYLVATSGGSRNTFIATSPYGATAGSDPLASDTVLKALSGIAGTTSAAVAIAQCLLATLGQPIYSGGPSYGTGSIAAVGGNVPSLNLSMVSGGGGGGGMSTVAAFAGGRGFPAAELRSRHLVSEGGTAGASGVDGGKGQDGYSAVNDWFFSGGGGGGSGFPTGTPSNGGNGGNGGWGCGGGGGGGCLTGMTPGVGGKGGPGFVLIVAW